MEVAVQVGVCLKANNGSNNGVPLDADLIPAPCGPFLEWYGLGFGSNPLPSFLQANVVFDGVSDECGLGQDQFVGEADDLFAGLG